LWRKSDILGHLQEMIKMKIQISIYWFHLEIAKNNLPQNRKDLANIIDKEKAQWDIDVQ
jgi:hypothetical protein